MPSRRSPPSSLGPLTRSVGLSEMTPRDAESQLIESPIEALHQKLSRLGFAMALPQELLSLPPSISHSVCHAVDKILDQYQLRGAMIENLIDDLNSLKSHLGQDTATELTVTLNLMDETLLAALKQEIHSSKLPMLADTTTVDMCRCGLLESYQAKVSECEKLAKKIQGIAEQIYLTKQRLASPSTRVNPQPRP